MGSINTKERIMQHTHTGMQAGSLDGVAVVLEVVNALVELVAAAGRSAAPGSSGPSSPQPGRMPYPRNINVLKAGESR